MTLAAPSGCKLLRSHDDGIRTFTIANPGRKNALSFAVRSELCDALHEADEDATVLAIIITGQNEDFCSGADINEVPRGMNAAFAYNYMSRTSQKVANTLFGLHKPVIARVRGVAAGAGMLLALSCDVVVAATDARFSLSQLQLGIAPDWAGLWHLPRLVGKARARRMVYSGRPIDGATAADWGMIAEAAEIEELDRVVQSYCTAIRKTSPLAMALTKDGLGHASEGSFDAFAAWEAAAIGLGLLGEDYEKAVDRFLDRRGKRDRVTPDNGENN